jgi:uncharacterized protein (TIGR03437 family)
MPIRARVSGALTAPALIALFASSLLLAAPDRLAAPIDSARMKPLHGFVHAKARPEADRGLADPALPIPYATLVLKPAGGLEAFLLSQQTPGSPDFHRWLTPDEFGQRFGASGNDTAKIVAWLEKQGLQVNTVARGGQWIAFSGTASSVGKAFRTELHRYSIDGRTHFANATEPSIPEALESLVAGFHGLNDFRARPMYRAAKTQPEFNSSSGNHFLAPDDVAAIYDFAPLYAAGIDGTGQTIAVVGQTNINLADIRAFRQRFNLPANDPQVKLFGASPGTVAGDFEEAELDLEWSGAIARNAQIVYVNSSDVFTSALNAIDNNLAPVLSMSYTFGCEAENTPDFRVFAQQANAQGITWVIASGDTGAAGCDFSSPTPQATKGRVAEFPSTLPEVTAIGGTTFSEGGGSYWSATPGPNSGSALSYIPEVAWNDSATRNELAGSGGGASYLYAKPFWQSAPGVPDDGARDIPDISFAASPDHDGYVVEIRGNLQVFGGTSLGTPVFAGLLALANQSLVAKGALPQPGLGNINPTLYRLAQSSTDVFHDVTGGSNNEPCAQASPHCVNGMLGYAAGPGYDLATGLGSVDAFHLIQEWSNGITGAMVLTAAPANANINDIVTLTATVTSAGTSKPSGVVEFMASYNSLGRVSLVPGAGSSATATLSVPEVRIAEGTGSVSALYGGDGVVSASGASAFVKLLIPSSGSLIIPSVDPNPVYQFGKQFIFSVALQEAAGVATRLTGFTIDGVNEPLSFFPQTNIAALGFIQITLASMAGTAPSAGAHVFRFTGADADGRPWTQQVTAVFLPSGAPAISPSILLTSVPSSVMRNTAADPGCQWSQQLTVQEQSGFLTTLSQFSINNGSTNSATNMSSQIQQIFGTTRLAPYGTLYGNLCWSEETVSATKTFTLLGRAEIGIAGATATASFAGPAAAPAAFTATPSALTFSVPDSSQTRTAPIDLTFTGGDAVWSIAKLPANVTTAWLTVTPASGEGPARVTVQASAAGLSKGVYYAYLTVQAPNAFPQAINIPVMLAVGGSPEGPLSLSIGEISNPASSGMAGAPGGQMNVIGLNLAPSTQVAARFPLPLTLAGVSVTVNGVAAPLYSVSPAQIKIQIPYETAMGTAIVAVNNNGQIAWHAVPVQMAAPAILVDANNSLAPGGTAQPGQTITMYITGDGDVTPTLATGASPPSGTPSGSLPHPRLPVTVTVGGTAAKVAFVGITPGTAGVTQINFTVPADTILGVHPVVVRVGNAASPPANLTVN